MMIEKRSNFAQIRPISRLVLLVLLELDSLSIETLGHQTEDLNKRRKETAQKGHNFRFGL
jgi:hypothetical protein